MGSTLDETKTDTETELTTCQYKRLGPTFNRTTDISLRAVIIQMEETTKLK